MTEKTLTELRNIAKELGIKSVTKYRKEELAKLETVIGAQDRLEMLSKDIIEHYEQREDILNGKAMIVCMTRKIAIDLYKEIIEKRPEWKDKIKVVLTDNNDDPTNWHEIVGNKNDIDADIKVIASKYNVQTSFTDEVVEEILNRDYDRLNFNVSLPAFDFMCLNVPKESMLKFFKSIGSLQILNKNKPYDHSRDHKIFHFNSK